MTRLDALLIWLATAGDAGATSAAIAQWAKRRNWPESTTATLLWRAVQRGHLHATPVTAGTRVRGSHYVYRVAPYRRSA